MKKVLLTLLIVIVALGALAAAGIAGFRIGYMNGATPSGNAPSFDRPYQMNPNQMPMHRFDNNFGPGSQPYGSAMMRRGGGFGLFSFFHFVWNIAMLGLIIWFVYWLFTKSGWRITRETGPNQNPPSTKTEG
jgi:hypothetical protein